MMVLQSISWFKGSLMGLISSTFYFEGVWQVLLHFLG